MTSAELKGISNKTVHEILDNWETRGAVVDVLRDEVLESTLEDFPPHVLFATLSHMFDSVDYTSMHGDVNLEAICDKMAKSAVQYGRKAGAI